MKVLVTGSRDWTDRAAIERAFDLVRPTLVIHGNNPRGADRIADNVALARQIDRCLFPANWARHGKSAGPVRNRRMFDTTQPDVVVAFPLPQSRGTVDMIDYARSRGCRVLVWGIDLS